MLLILVLIGVLLYIICTKYGIITNQNGGGLGEMETAPPFTPISMPDAVTSVVSSLETSLPSLPSLPSLQTPSAEEGENWFCDSKFYAPLTFVGNNLACMTEDGKNCSWGYCEGTKIIKDLPKAKTPLACDLSSPDSWCSKAKAETDLRLVDKLNNHPANDDWMCGSDFYAPVKRINNSYACYSKGDGNCAKGYCEGNKFVKAPNDGNQILCDPSSPDSWCSKAAQVIKNKKKTVEKLDEKVDNLHESLSEMNKTLDRKGTLTEEEQKRVQRAAVELHKAEEQIHSEEEILKSSQEEVQRGVSEISKDEKTAKQLVIQSAVEGETKPLTLKNHITLIKGVLDNHNKRLRRLESYLCQVKSEMHSSKYLLSDMANKLNDGIKQNKFHSATEETDKITVDTIKTVKKSLQCPVCPMYEQGLVSPTGGLDMWKAV